MEIKRAAAIKAGEVSLGIELGSTRIKAILIDDNYDIVAQGDFEWKNELVNGVWTYSLVKIWNGISVCYSNLKKDVFHKYGVKLTKIKNIGISAMMHGYIVLDEKEDLLVPFRTWRNTSQEEASKYLSELYSFPIPQRWSNAHIYQAILNEEEHVNKIAHQTTLAGYVHYMLTGKFVMGVGEASGMFPIDIKTKQFNKKYLQQFNDLVHSKGIEWDYEDLLPEVLVAGQEAGRLTDEGAKRLDPSGELEAGSILCPPEGDAGTGMVATGSVATGTGNISAGTSVFAMIVLEKELKKMYGEIDLVTTPSGDMVAMVHCNNCTSNLNRWINMLEETINTFGFEVSKNELYTKLFKKALEGDLDAGGLLSYEYLSGEHITGFEQGRPMVMSKPDSNFNLANFIRCSLYSSLGTLKIGLDILLKEEKISIEKIYGHGGFFKTEEVGQKIMSQATTSPISVMETAGEGGAWGIAILSAFHESGYGDLSTFLDEKIFNDSSVITVEASKKEIEGFEIFMERYKKGLEIENSAVKNLV